MAFKRNKKKPKMYRGKKSKYSAAEKRAFWVGYGRRLEQIERAYIHFDSLSNPEKLSMNFGGDAASKKYGKFN